MRFLSLFKPSQFSNSDPEKNAAIGRLIEEEMKAGTLLATEGFYPSPQDVRVRRAKGKVTVTDGPFTEAKELIGGFAILRAKSRDEAVELARRFLEVVGDGECEIHELPDVPL